MASSPINLSLEDLVDHMSIDETILKKERHRLRAQLEEINMSYSSVLEELRELETLRRSNCTLYVDDVIKTTVCDAFDCQSVCTTEMEESYDELESSAYWDSTDVTTATSGSPSVMTSKWTEESPEEYPEDFTPQGYPSLPGCCDRHSVASVAMAKRQPRRASSLSHFSTSLCEIPSSSAGGCLPLRKRYLSVRRKFRSIRHLIRLRLTGRVLAVL